jgi:hypothetical protein
MTIDNLEFIIHACIRTACVRRELASHAYNAWRHTWPALAVAEGSYGSANRGVAGRCMPPEAPSAALNNVLHRRSVSGGCFLVATGGRPPPDAVCPLGACAPCKTFSRGTDPVRP